VCEGCESARGVCVWRILCMRGVCVPSFTLYSHRPAFCSHRVCGPYSHRLPLFTPCLWPLFTPPPLLFTPCLWPLFTPPTPCLWPLFTPPPFVHTVFVALIHTASPFVHTVFVALIHSASLCSRLVCGPCSHRLHFVHTVFSPRAQPPPPRTPRASTESWLRIQSTRR